MDLLLLLIFIGCNEGWKAISIFFILVEIVAGIQYISDNGGVTSHTEYCFLSVFSPVDLLSPLPRILPIVIVLKEMLGKKLYVSIP